MSSNGAFITKEAPDRYQSIAQYVGEPDFFEAADFLKVDYFDSTAEHFLRDKAGLDDDGIRRANELLGSVLAQMQQRSLVPVGVTQRASAAMLPDERGRITGEYSTLSFARLASGIRFCVDALLMNLKEILPESFELQLNRTRRAISKRLREEQAAFNSPLEPPEVVRVGSGVELAEMPVEDFLSPEALAFFNQLPEPYSDAAKNTVLYVARVLFESSRLDVDQFRREVGDPSLQPSHFYVSLDKTGDDAHVVPFNEKELLDPPAVDNRYALVRNRHPSRYVTPETRTGILPPEATHYSTLNPQELVYRIRHQEFATLLAPFVRVSIFKTTDGQAA